jgi:hypothetical protein
MVTEHAPSCEQQEPDGGCGQTLGWQLALSVQTLGETQLTWLDTVQEPVAPQQLPCGGRHGFGGPHVRPPVQTFGAAQYT